MTTTKLSPSTRRRKKFHSKEHLCSEAVKEPSSNVSASFDELDPEQHIFKSADDEEQACTIQELMVPVAQDLDEMTANLKNVIGRKNPLLIAAADQIFGAGGKRLRPVLVLLVARATAALMKLPDISGISDRGNHGDVAHGEFSARRCVGRVRREKREYDY